MEGTSLLIIIGVIIALILIIVLGAQMTKAEHASDAERRPEARGHATLTRRGH